MIIIQNSYAFLSSDKQIRGVPGYSIGLQNLNIVFQVDATNQHKAPPPPPQKKKNKKQKKKKKNNPQGVWKK